MTGGVKWSVRRGVDQQVVEHFDGLAPVEAIPLS
jgi:hypothetical protein